MRYRETDEYVPDLLRRRTDAKAQRIRWMLELPDLTLDPESPVHHIIEAIKAVPPLYEHDLVEFPEIVTVEESFDLLGTPADHPSRSPGDTFYLDETHILRTQTTTMWSYYLRDARVIERLNRQGHLLALSCGKVYRNDEIDRSHYPVFHQVDGLRIEESGRVVYRINDLEQVLIAIAHTLFGPDVRYRIEDDSFPFTDPSIQFQIELNNEWVEVLGAGLVNKRVLALLGIDPLRYNGWAFGIGLDRLAMVKMGIPDIRILWSRDERIRGQLTDLESSYSAVSRFPAVDRDISFIVPAEQPLNPVYDLMRSCGRSGDGDVIEEVKHIDAYRNDRRLGAGRISHTFRIRYRSLVRSLTNEEVNGIQETLRRRVMEEFGGELR